MSAGSENTLDHFSFTEYWLNKYLLKIQVSASTDPLTFTPTHNCSQLYWWIYFTRLTWVFKMEFSTLLWDYYKSIYRLWSRSRSVVLGFFGHLFVRAHFPSLAASAPPTVQVEMSCLSSIFIVKSWKGKFSFVLLKGLNQAVNCCCCGPSKARNIGYWMSYRTIEMNMPRLGLDMQLRYRVCVFFLLAHISC